MNKLTASLCLFTAATTVFLDSSLSLARCIEEDWVLLNEKIVHVGACLPGEALTLSKKDVNYPLMRSSPCEVEYWRGSFVRRITMQSTFLHLILDKCSPRDDVIVSEHVSQSTDSDVEFAVDNPNLADSVAATYDLVPMTDQEANEALKKARHNCEAYSLQAQ